MKGKISASKTYVKDPLDAAERWRSEGADVIHVVDLDSALETGFDNHLQIAKIVKGVDLPVQVGGGIRSLEYASSLLGEGAARIVVGTVAFRDRPILEKMLEAFGYERVVVALDYEAGEVMVRGWRSPTGLRLQDALIELRDAGVKRFLLTSVERDGMLAGPDYENLAEACRVPGVRILASGGVASVTDLISLREVGVEGVVIGKALYEGRFGLREALSALRGGRS